MLLIAKHSILTIISSVLVWLERGKQQQNQNQQQKESVQHSALLAGSPWGIIATNFLMRKRPGARQRLIAWDLVVIWPLFNLLRKLSLWLTLALCLMRRLFTWAGLTLERRRNGCGQMARLLSIPIGWKGSLIIVLETKIV